LLNSWERAFHVNAQSIHGGKAREVGEGIFEGRRRWWKRTAFRAAEHVQLEVSQIKERARVLSLRSG
jgi:hypothetical protein